ncbi:MAG: tyrosine-type recombinase/integrase [Chthonomonas sp.]|nr:tyrosine-type recombinase/integrase [Chthonomonas sp.]
MKGRADDNDGSCREILTGRHAGKWRVQFRYLDESGVKRRLSKLFRTKTEGKKYLQALRRGERVKEAALIHELTFGEWFEWLAVNDWPETLASVTIAQRRARFRKYCSKAFGSQPLNCIDALKVRAFYRGLREQGASNSLVVSVKSDLVRAFNQAINPYQQVPQSLANPFRLSVSQPKPRLAIALSAEQVKSAVNNPSLNSSQRALLGLLLLAGLRLGEAMAITRQQIRIDESLIAVDRAVKVEFGGKQSVGLPKNDKTRNAVMCQTLKSILSPFIAELEPEDFLWPAASENKPRMKKRFYELWKAAAVAAGLPKEMSPHDCRLTHINLVEKLMPRVSATTLKEHVGHSAAGVTEANYTRPITASQEILRSELDGVFG